VLTRKYEINPPILHRKELLLPSDHHDIPKFVALTKQLEDAGLFKDSLRIGYKKQWEERLYNAGYKVVDHKLIKLDGSEIQIMEVKEQTSNNIDRYRTALTRYALSKPMQLLAKHDFLEGKHTIFDYGCGKGSDVDLLRQNNLIANGWDPHFCPDNPKYSADIVNLGFVINVIEDKTERMEAVLNAYQLCTQFLCAAVMLGEQSSERGRLFSDGVLTSRNTFQRYYSQEEFREYLRHLLDEDPVAVGPGVFFVFKDKDVEQAFLERRYRNHATANRLINQLPKTPKTSTARLTKADKERIFYEQNATLLDALWLRWLELGRPPQDDEFPDLAAITNLFSTAQQALKFMYRFHGDELLKLSFDSRRDDLMVYFAMRRFDQYRVYRHLPKSLKHDIKTFFKNYQQAQSEGERLLFSAGNPTLIRQMCQQAATLGYGYLDNAGSLTFHTSKVVALPPVLRVYIGCATFVFGDVTSADLLKIHAESGKLSLMKYDEFEESPLPRLVERIKISLVNQRLEYYKYGDIHTPPYLYRKARFLTPDFPNYDSQVAFDQALLAHSEFELDGYGMSPEQFDSTLKYLRLEINGFTLQPAQILPSLDDPCGKYYTFRNFIECGETQAKIGLPNLPKQAESYNALAALARHIIDPIIDYFGGIQLTYGFCSPELARNITGRIDPKLDQHAACEVNTRGSLVCERKGAACDFIIPDEDMLEVAQWLVQNTPFDRLYYYGADKPIHVSYSSTPVRMIVHMLTSKTNPNRLTPKIETLINFCKLD
jgi:DNA phosphorothioation-associated putative methyltransferase